MGVIEVNFVYSDGEDTMFVSDDYLLSLPAETFAECGGTDGLLGIEILRYYPERTFDAHLA